jgi:diguanylate cyclase (GGDEF)-like protein
VKDQHGLSAIRQAVREGREVRVVLRNFRKDGEMFWNELYLSPVRDRAGVLTHFVGLQNDVTVEMESTQNLEHLAHHDALTGLVNRAYLMVQLRQATLRARRSGRTLAVLFFDLDNFKQVNDVLGHEAGDKLLQVIATRLSGSARAGETVARLGGDEFVVILEDVAGEQMIGAERGPDGVLVKICEPAQRLLTALGEATEIAGAPIHPSASVGMAVFPQDGETPEELLRAADMNMYMAKHDARGKRQREDEGMNEDETALESDGAREVQRRG